jgi:hypothetical protein
MRQRPERRRPVCRLLQIGAHHVDQLFGATHPLAVVPMVRIKDMRANVVFHHLRHEPIHGAAGGGNELQHLGALDLSLQSTLDRFDLAAQAAYAIEELALLSDGV